MAGLSLLEIEPRSFIPIIDKFQMHLKKTFNHISQFVCSIEKCKRHTLISFLKSLTDKTKVSFVVKTFMEIVG